VTTTTARPPVPLELDGPIDAGEIRSTRPVVLWAGLGGLALAAYLYLIGAWILSGDMGAVSTGPTPVPTYMKVAIRAWEGIMVGGLLPILYFKVYRERKRAGHFAFDGLLILALLTIFWQDLFMNWGQFSIAYNAYFLNLGSWYEHVPGWVTPNTMHATEPLLGILPLYAVLEFGAILIVNWMMRRLSRRWPRLRSAGIFGICVVVLTAADFVAEALIMMPLGLYTYTSPIPWLTIFHGHYYQWPIYEGVLSGVFLTALGYLRWYRNDKGESWAERGLSSYNLTARRRSLVRFLALCGICNAVQLTMYAVPWNYLGMNSGDTPRDVSSRSYFVGVQCGPLSDYACPSPDVPLPRRTSAHLDPHGELVVPQKGR
jgi:hypothetical protein